MWRRSPALLATLSPASFYKHLTDRKHDAFFGVPDSLLKDFCAYITDHAPKGKHVITANEGNAVAMASGYHLATGHVPVVYLQNSGIGNTLNPLLSLTHAEVCKVPLLLLVGWRGDPEGKKDEPQHVAQGRLMAESLAAAEVPFSVLEATDRVADDALEALRKAEKHFKAHGTPYALLIKRDTFGKHKLAHVPEQLATNAVALELSREEAIDAVMQAIGERDLIVSTTGMPSREVFECRARRGQSHDRDFLTVGCMGHASSIAAGVSLGMESGDGRNVFVVDGDGAALMHLGALPVNASLRGDGKLRNFKHVVVNNAAHDSVGGQPTVAMNADLTKIAAASGYRCVRPSAVKTKDELNAAVAELRQMDGPAFLEVHVRTGNRADLGRPTRSPETNKKHFMQSLLHP